MAPFSSISPFSFSSFSFFSFPLPDRAFPLRGKKKKKEKALLVWPVLARFPRSTAFHGLTFCVPGERPLVAFIAVIIRPPPTWTTAWKEPADRLAHVSPGKRARKKDTPPPLPPSTSPSSVQAAVSQPGPWHFNGVHALLDRKDGTWRGLRLVTRGRKGWRKRLDGSSSKGLGNIWCKIVFKERILELDGDGW